jgi:hypothetical protein
VFGKGYAQSTAVIKKITNIERIDAASASDFGVSHEEMAELFKGSQQLIAVHFK